MVWKTDVDYTLEYLKGLIRKAPTIDYSKSNCIKYFDGCAKEKLIQKHAVASKLPFLNLIKSLESIRTIKNGNKVVVVDLGCGTGELERSNILPQDSFICMVDYSKNMINCCKDILTNADIHLIIGDGENLPFKSGIFDMVIMINMLPYIKYINKLLEDVRRIIKSNGSIIIVNPIPSPLWEEEFDGIRIILRDPYNIKASLKDVGFKIIEIKRCYFRFILPLPIYKIPIAEAIVAIKGPVI